MKIPKIPIPEHVMANGSIRLTITGQHVEMQLLYYGAVVFERRFLYGSKPATVE